MKVYRIEKKDYKDQFPPKGSLFSDGRWNRKGTWVVYTSDSIALAMLETLANSGVIPKNRYLRVIEIRDDAPLVKLSVKDLPDDWMDFPYPATLAEKIKGIIDMGEFAGAIVPSIQSPRENNVLLFPDFREFNIYIQEKENSEVIFDPRLK